MTTHDTTDGDCPLVRVPGQDAVIEGNRAVALKRPLHLAIEFVGIGDFGNAADEQLRAQADLDAQIVVEPALQRIAPKLVRLPGRSTNHVAGLVGALQCRQQGSMLFRSGVQFDLCDHFHTIKCTISEQLCQSKVALRRLLTTLQRVGFRAYHMPYQLHMRFL